MIVDALLGTGFRGEPRGEVAAAIAAIARSGAPVVSVDVPSGVDASTRRSSRASAVYAAADGHLPRRQARALDRARQAARGEVQVVDIGIPRGAPQKARASG